MSFLKKVWSFFLDTVETAAIAFGIFLVIYGFIAQPHEVKGSSMYATLENGDFLLTDKISYRFHEPSRGDIVVFKSPVNPRVEYIKRVIGLPGETIEISDGRTYINSQPLREPYLPQGIVTAPESFLTENNPYTIPEGEYIVMGDNRLNSSDSRVWGTVPAENIVGRVFFRYWPPKKVEAVDTPEYAL